MKSKSPKVIVPLAARPFRHHVFDIAVEGIVQWLP